MRCELGAITLPAAAATAVAADDEDDVDK